MFLGVPITLAVYWLKPTELPKAMEKHSRDEQTKEYIYLFRLVINIVFLQLPCL